jgi:hypothetical protein
MDDNRRLAEALERIGADYSVHEVEKKTGRIVDPPEVRDPNRLVTFGSYAMQRFADENGYRPGVFPVTPFIEEAAWDAFLLNSRARTRVVPAGYVPDMMRFESAAFFLRPMADSKEILAGVLPAGEIARVVANALAGGLDQETMLMLSKPAVVLKEWRLWVVGGEVVTHSLYREGQRVVYRHEIDIDALSFGKRMAAANPRYAEAYVMDVCRTGDGMRLLETNAIGAAGYYAGDMLALACAIEELG